MSIDWKPVAVSALLAFIIAVVTAGISGVPFGVLLFRAVLGALIFGAGAVGVQYLVAKFLPELAQGEDEAPQTGGSVDIVISDDDADEEGAEYDEFDEEESVFEPGMPAASGEMEETESEPFVEEVEEAEVPSGEDTYEDVDEAESATVDTLPDVGEFTDSFMADAGTETPPHDTAGPRGDGQDPESLAKAIRTLMKREES